MLNVIKKKNYNDLFIDLKQYMLNETNINKSLKMESEIKIDVKSDEKFEIKFKTKPKEKNDVKPEIKPKEKNDVKLEINPEVKINIYYPKQEDTLFWCFYIIKNNFIKYESLYQKNSFIAKQMKIDYIDTIRKNKEIIKKYKFDTISNIENNLVNDKIINIKTFLILLAIENKNVIYVKKNMYYSLCVNDSDEIYIIYEKTINSNYNIKKYGYEIATKEILNNIYTNFYKLEGINKPIKTISFYKINDLIQICNKLAIEVINEKTKKTKLKNELYELIIETLK